MEGAEARRWNDARRIRRSTMCTVDAVTRGQEALDLLAKMISLRKSTGFCEGLQESLWHIQQHIVTMELNGMVPEQRRAESGHWTLVINIEIQDLRCHVYQEPPYLSIEMCCCFTDDEVMVLGITNMWDVSVSQLHQLMNCKCLRALVGVTSFMEAGEGKPWWSKGSGKSSFFHPDRS
jgi:hypothetical protein